ncbi:RHS repeat-associated core domain-containing protein [Treponema bryantii]|uniref:RHS repeat domain-containing protein n=1 Tax=Treponema bryantii TaxID=163 RepID=UPI002B30933D|nr:hypothetical protein TRBR_28750 [Treponema bryantii]
MVYYHHIDHLGTTEVVTDENGTVVWEAGYEAIGSILNEKGDSKFTPSYTGKFFVKASGLYYFNARWYDSELGRFTVSDPIRDGVNWWNYCNVNPIVLVDWQGLSPTRDDYAYQIRTQSEKNTVDYYNSFNLETDYALQNQGYSNTGKWNNIICPQIDNNISGLFNLDFGQDYFNSSNEAAQNKQYFASFMYKLDAIGESLIDSFVAYKSAENLGSIIATFKEQFSKNKNVNEVKKPYSNSRPPYAKGPIEVINMNEVIYGN